jgi:protoporphyrinogen oxidase
MRERISEDAERALVEPVCNTFCTASGDEVSLAFYLALGKYGSEGNVLAPVDGWTAALDAVVNGLDVLRKTRVNSLEQTTRGLRATLSDGSPIDCDAAVIATGSSSASALLDGLGGSELIEWLSGVQTRATFTVAAVVRAALPHDAFGIMQHNDGSTAVSALAVHDTKGPPRASGDGEILLAWPTPNAAARLAGAPPRQIAEACVPEIERLLPAARGCISHVRVYRLDPGNPLPRPGFAAARERGRSLAEAIDAPVALAGDYLTMPLIEGAVASGQRAAAQIRAKIGA